MPRTHARQLTLLLVALPLVVFGTGCTNLAEDVATHLANHDFAKAGHDVTLFEGDIALFRTCLGQRGGSCQGSTSTALPLTSQEGSSETILPIASEGSTKLTQSLTELPAGHPAKIAYGVLQHPLTHQATALHDALRGHENATPGITLKTEKNDDGTTQSTLGLNLKLNQATHFHDRLLSSVSSGGWPALGRHCEALMAEEKARLGQASPKPDHHDPDYHDLFHSCRHITFVRDYLGAYIDRNQFLEVDVALVGTLTKIQDNTRSLQQDLQTLRGALVDLRADAKAAAGGSPVDLANDVRATAANLQALLTPLEPKVKKYLGQSLSDDLGSLLSKVDEEAGKLAKLLQQSKPEGVQALANDLGLLLGELDSQLLRLETGIGDLGQELAHWLNQGTDAINTKLSNVFRVSKVGFVSRESTFLARLPTLELTLDPTAKHLLTVTDVDTGQTLDSHSDLGSLGVARDISGVGTGASIGAELTRVFLEATFDAHESLPAIVPANALSLGSSGLTLNGVVPTGVSLGPFSLPTFELSPTNPIDSRDLGHILRTNDAVALNTRLLVGRIISGIGPFNLDNPPIEALITEIITTSVRKAAEKVTWCWYACELNTDLHHLHRDVDESVDNKAKHLERQAEHAAKARAREAATWADRQAHTIKLHLRLGS